MEFSLSSMDEKKLLKEYLLLSKVYQNLESLLPYNTQFLRSIHAVDADLKKIKGQLFFRYPNHKMIKIESLVLTGSDLQSRMEKYITDI